MNIKTFICFLMVPITLFLFTACKDTTNESSASNESTPFESLTTDDIKEVRLVVDHYPGEEPILNDEQTAQLVDILNRIVIYDKVSEQILNGQMVQIHIAKTDGSSLIFKALNPYIIIDDVWYNAKYEPCEELNQFANEMMESPLF